MGLKYYVDTKYAPLSDLLRQANNKTENQLMTFSDYSWKYCPDTGKITGEYLLFNQGGIIDHGTNVPGPVAQSSGESDYNAAYTAGISFVHFMMLINKLMNKDPDIVTEEDPLIILDNKSTACMAKNGKDTNNTRYIARRVHL